MLMIWRRQIMPVLAGALLSGTAHAQPADLPIPPAATTDYPIGISVRKLDGGSIYVDANGQTLYGMDMRTLARFGPDPAQYCQEDCARDWEPVLAPEGSKPNIAFPQGFSHRIQQALLSGKQFRPGGGSSGQRPAPAKGGDAVNTDEFYSNPQQAPDWTIIEGPQGPQWVYKGWHMVFIRKGEKPGSVEFEGHDDLTWNTLKFIPPVPEIVAPKRVSAKFVEGTYVMANEEGRLLFTGRCRNNCSSWEPFGAGMANRGVGSWKVDLTADTPLWTYRGKPVFVSNTAEPELLPKGAKLLRP